MFSEIRPSCGSWKHASFLTWYLENKLLKRCVSWMIDSRIHRNMKTARGGSVPKTRLLWPSTQQIWKYGRAILSISTMTKDCHDELGSQFLLHRDLYKFLTVRPVWFFFFSFFSSFLFFFSVLFLDTKLHILDECLLCACNEKITLA